MIKKYKTLPLMMIGVAVLSLAACDDSSKQTEQAAAETAVETLEATINAPVVNAMAATSFATAQGSTTGAVFLTLQNAGAEDDRLVGVTTSKSSIVEIHENVFDDETGVMQMRKIDGLTIPAAGEAELTPKGYHIMLMGLTEALVEGTSFDVTLDFEKAPDVVVPVSVVSAGAAEATHDHGDMGHEGHNDGAVVAPEGEVSATDAVVDKAVDEVVDEIAPVIEEVTKPTIVPETIEAPVANEQPAQ